MSEKFSVQITPSVEDDLKDLEPYRNRVIQELLVLEDNPLLGHSLKGKLSGLRSLEFSLPGGACRGVYGVKTKEQVCLVVIVGYHESLYERAERRVKALRRQGILKEDTACYVYPSSQIQEAQCRLSDVQFSDDEIFQDVLDIRDSKGM